MPRTTDPSGKRLRPGRRRLAASIAAVGALAVACGTASGSSDDGPDELTIATSFAISDLVPLENGFWAPEFGYGDLLMRPLPGGEVEPWVLEDLQPAGETTWELTLRGGVTFQNGNPLEAGELAELMNWHLENNSALGPLLEGAHAEATGSLTVELTTAEAAPNVPSLLANESYFVLFDLVAYEELEGDLDELTEARIYTGPYTVTSLSSERMVLDPTDGYYGGDQPLERVTVLFIPDAESRVRAVRSGEADLALYPPTSAERQLDGRSDAYYLIEPAGAASGGMQLFVNQHTAPLDDPDVRKALQLAMDYEAIAHDVMNGLYDPSTGLYPAFLPEAVDLLETDPDAAEDLLAAAGWERDGNGVRTRDGEELSLRLLTYPQQPDVGLVAVALQDQLRQIGVDLQVVEVDDIGEVLRDPSRWELGISMNSMLGMTGTDPLAPLVTYYLSTGERNHGGIDDPELDGLINQLAVTGDEGEQSELLEQIQRIIVEDQAYGWYVSLKRTPVVASPDLQDYPVPVANLWMTPYQPQP